MTCDQWPLWAVINVTQARFADSVCGFVFRCGCCDHMLRLVLGSEVPACWMWERAWIVTPQQALYLCLWLACATQIHYKCAWGGGARIHFNTITVEPIVSNARHSDNNNSQLLWAVKSQFPWAVRALETTLFMLEPLAYSEYWKLWIDQKNLNELENSVENTN
jgi:hypothetical protein